MLERHREAMEPLAEPERVEVQPEPPGGASAGEQEAARGLCVAGARPETDMETVFAPST